MESTASVGRANNNNASRRVWTLHEETALVNALKEIVTRGWKCDNGFKNGYQHTLEQMLLNALPGTDIRAEPHISSKIHVWKKRYGSLNQMMCTSGFGWNDANCTITVRDDSIWNNYIKVDKNAKSLRHKSFPFFKDWVDIFGKDRATGENAQTFVDGVNDPLVNDVPPMPPPNGPTLGRTETAENVPNSSGLQAESHATSRAQRGKKRKVRVDADERVIEIMQLFADRTDARLGELAQRLGVEHNIKMQRKAVFEALEKLHFLSIPDRLTISKSLCMNNVLLDLFFSLSDENKAIMVKMMLEGW